MLGDQADFPSEVLFQAASHGTVLIPKDELSRGVRGVLVVAGSHKMIRRKL